MVCLIHAAQYSGSIAESTEVGNQVLRVVATDADSGRFGEISYTILMGNEVNTLHLTLEWKNTDYYLDFLIILFSLLGW